MRILMAMASTLTLIATASAQPNRATSETTEVEADPLYHVEVILFAFNEGNRGEEDLRHGLETRRLEPLPELLRLPKIELESVFNLRGTESVDRLTEASPDQPIETTPEPNDVESLPENADAILELPLETALALPDSLIALEDDALELFETGFSGDPGSFISDVEMPAGFRALAREEMELGAAAARMNRRPYTLLGYAGWEQAGVDPDRSVQLDLKRVGITNPTGTIEVDLRRFLRVVIDLEFFESSGTLWTAPAGSGLTPFAYAQSYELSDEANAIRSGELHFIDHPLFGMLIRITPAPEPEDESGTEDTESPAG